MDKEKRIFLQVSVDIDFHTRLKIEAAKQRTTMQALMMKYLTKGLNVSCQGLLSSQIAQSA